MRFASVLSQRVGSILSMSVRHIIMPTTLVLVLLKPLFHVLVIVVSYSNYESSGWLCAGERIFRIGSVRYRMDPSRRTLQRISGGQHFYINHFTWILRTFHFFYTFLAFYNYLNEYMLLGHCAFDVFKTFSMGNVY